MTEYQYFIDTKRLSFHNDSRFAIIYQSAPTNMIGRRQ